MKKTFYAILAILLLTIVGCNDLSAQPSIESTSSVVSTTAISDIWYDLTSIKVHRVNTQLEVEFDLNSKEIEMIVSIWNDGNWEPQITKTAYDYLFKFPDDSIRYVSELGLFNDPENNRHLYVTEEQRVLINSFLD